MNILIYSLAEVILQKGHAKPVDWWSFGTLLYEMMVGIPPFYNRDVQEMYQRILHSDLVIPDFISSEGQDLLARLLERDPKRRLGSGRTGSNEIRNHPFFKKINWDDVYAGKIPTPYTPNVKDDMDVSFFEEEFTKRPIKDSLSKKNTLIPKEQKMFAGFTFSGEGSLKRDHDDSSNPFLDSGNKH
jgi:serine/threonine protein kinase